MRLYSIFPSTFDRSHNPQIAYSILTSEMLLIDQAETRFASPYSGFSRRLGLFRKHLIVAAYRLEHTQTGLP